MKRVAVLGSGLLGGSIALAVQARVPGLSVALWGRREQAIADALAQGVEEASTDMARVIDGADLIILATPVGAMLEILELAASQRSLKGVMITDVGSVKLTPRDNLKATVMRIGSKYIGSHPMAGSEQAGVAAAEQNLFVDAACVITNDFGCCQDDLDCLKGFWESIGCRCYVASAEDHDKVMARISHLPHMLASVAALVGLKYREDGKFAGNGMRDTTRVASGHPGMWAEILIRNRDALRDPIEEVIGYLREVLALLESSGEEELASLLEKAKELRDQL